MRAGRLRNRVIIEEATRERDYRDGGSYVVWKEAARRWARIKPLTGRELFAARQVQSDVSHEITMRWLPGMESTEHRICFGNRIFNIGAVMNIEERNREARLLCTERINDDQESQGDDSAC